MVKTPDNIVALALHAQQSPTAQRRPGDFEPTRPILLQKTGELLLVPRGRILPPVFLVPMERDRFTYNLDRFRSVLPKKKRPQYGMPRNDLAANILEPLRINFRTDLANELLKEKARSH